MRIARVALLLTLGALVPGAVPAGGAPAGKPRAVTATGGCGRFTPRDGRRWESECIGLGARLVLSDEGLRVEPCGRGPSAWFWGLDLRRHGWNADLRTSGTPFLAVHHGRADLLHGSLREWLQSGEAGIAHGLEIPDGPAGVLYGRFDFALLGDLLPKVAEDGQSVAFTDRDGRPVLTLAHLRGEDASGRDVAVRWEWVEHPGDSPPVLRLVLRASDPAYPLRVRETLVIRGASAAPEAGMVPGAETVLVAPANDDCPGAEIVPGAGPFPYLTPVVDLTDAGTAGDPAVPSCQSVVSRSVWFAFTPEATASYSFSVCADAPTSTTLEDTVLAVYQAAGLCSGLVEAPGACSDDTCGPTGLQSSVAGLPLTAGTTYYIVVWSYGSAAPPANGGSVQLRVNRDAAVGPPPANDTCAGAEVIPAAGPFPWLTAVTADVSGATSAGDPPAPSCQPAVSRSVWYTFTPAASGRYTLSTCADAPTGSTANDTVLAIYTATTPCEGFQEVPGGCDDDSCGSEAAQSVLEGIDLTAGTTYDIVVWQYGSAALAPGNTAVQLRVTSVSTPAHDTCSSAAPLSVDATVTGSTASASDDTRLPAGSACFGGIGQTASTAPGRDVVYRFIAPEEGRFSFRLAGDDSARDAVLYVASDCPGGGPPATIAQCLGAANRTANSPEEIACLPLAAGQGVYVYVDENDFTAGGAFSLEATRCATEMEPNGTPASAGESPCGVEGSIAPAGDADLFSLGIPGAGARVFAIVDGATANSTDFDLRVVTAADTLEYDDFNNDVPFGVVAPNVAGTSLAGTPAYLRVSHYSPLAQAEPYRLYASVQAPSGAAVPEVEPDDTVATATAGASEYYAGGLSGSGDVDVFRLQGQAGEVLQIGLDLDPTRDGTPFNGTLALLDAAGATLVLVNDPSANSSRASGAGTLEGSTPFSPAEGLVYRVRSTGSYYARVAWAGGTPGDYLLSVSHGCRVLPGTDLEVSQTCSPDPVPPGGDLSCAVRVSNLGPHAAATVTLMDDPPEGTTLVSATATQGICEGAGPVRCHLGTLAPGASVTVDLVVVAPGAPDLLANRARVTTSVVDVDPANDEATVTVTAGSSDLDGDGVPDSADCAPADGSVWAAPGEALGLVFPPLSDPGRMEWSPPASPGSTTISYDLLRSTSPGDLQGAACLLSGAAANAAIDPALPTGAFYYLVRSRNGCGSSLGVGSDGTPRNAPSCP